MIGGIDIHIPSRAGDSSMELAIRAVLQNWPAAVFENGITGERYDYIWKIPLGDVEEMFVYRDHAAADAWDEEGAVPRLYNSMVHLLADPGLITVVVDEKDAAMETIIAAIRSSLEADIRRQAAKPETAG